MTVKCFKDKGVWLGAAFFALCALMTAVYLIAGYGAYLDSDMSSELVLARQLVSERALFSPQWYYSTEVRLLNTQLVFTPLMAAFGGDWQLVRTLGCMILLAVQAVCSLYAAQAIGAKLPYALAFAGLGVCVCSPLYAQNVIIGAYYIPHAVLTLLMLGLYGSWIRRRGGWRAAALLVLAFVMGLSSIRYLLAAIVPLAGAALWQFVFPAGGEADRRTPEQLKEVGLGLGVGAAGAAGYVLGKRLLPMLFHISADYYGNVGYASFSQHDLGMQLQSVAYGLLYAMGFEEGVPLFGAQGILNALVLLELFVSTLLVLRALKNGPDTAGRGAVLTLVFAFALSLASFVLLRSVYFDRYWLPVMMLGAPVLALCLSREKNAVLRGLSMLLFAGTVLLCSASTMYYSMRSPQLVRDGWLDVVRVAEENGLAKGYATFWNANVITEASDGAIDVAGVEWVREDGRVCGMEPFYWLETDRDFAADAPDAPVFLLIGEWEGDGFEAMLSRMQAREAACSEWFRFYIVPSQEMLLREMRMP